MHGSRLLGRSCASSRRRWRRSAPRPRTIPSPAILSGSISWSTRSSILRRNPTKPTARDRDVDLHILGMAADHTIDRVVLGQDDAGPVGLHIPDVQALQGAVARLGIADRASIEPGADELGLVLVAHAMAHAAGWTPRVAVRYSMPDGGDVQDPLEFAPISSACDALIRLAGAVRNELDPDIILYVRVPNTDGIHDAALLHELSAETAAGKSVALVDLSFLSGSYEPQARFVRRLIRAGVAAKLDAYASWNTNANSTGIALAEAIAAGVGRR